MSFSIVMLGTGSPRPNIKRSGPAQVLKVNNEAILIDCGEGTTNQLLKANIPPESIKSLWFTHLHSDHTLGYGQFLLGGWGQGRNTLTIFGPKGTKDFHEKILDLYKEDIDYRMSLGRSGEGILDVNIIEITHDGEVTDSDELRVTCKSMVHNVPTFGYRFETNQGAIVISGDTAPHDGIIELARDANVLVLDAALTQGKKSPALSRIWEQLQKEHCTPQQAAEIAQKANVETLVMTHFLPESDPKLDYRDAAGHFSGEVVIPEDLDEIYVLNRRKIKI